MSIIGIFWHSRTFFCHFFFSIFLFLSSKETSVLATKYCDSIIMFTCTWPLLPSHDYQWVLLLLNLEPWNPKVCTVCCPLFYALIPINLYLDLLWFSVFLPTFIPAYEYPPCFSSFAIFLIYIPHSIESPTFDFHTSDLTNQTFLFHCSRLLSTVGENPTIMLMTSHLIAA